MTKRDDVIVPTPGDGEAAVADTGAERRGVRGGANRQSNPQTQEAPEETPAGHRSDNHSRSDEPSPRLGMRAIGTSEWASLADPHGEAPGGTYSTGIIGHGADIGVLGTDSGTGTGVGVLGTVTNPENGQPAVYGFTQGVGPGVQGESDGPGPGLLGTDNGTGTGYAVLGELTNPLNTRAAIYGTTAGTGAGVEGDSQRRWPRRLRVQRGDRARGPGRECGIQTRCGGPGVRHRRRRPGAQ